MQPRGSYFALRSRHNYITKRLVKRLHQPMIARLIKATRRQKIPHEIEQNLVKERTSALVHQSRDVFIGLTLSHDVSHEK